MFSISHSRWLIYPFTKQPHHPSSYLSINGFFNLTLRCW